MSAWSVPSSGRPDAGEIMGAGSRAWTTPRCGTRSWSVCGWVPSRSQSTGAPTRTSSLPKIDPWMPPTTAQGQVFMGRDFNNQPDYSDEIAFQIDKEIRRIVDESYDTAEDLLVPTGPSWTS
jgi:hypothetical protein